MRFIHVGVGGFGLGWINYLKDEAGAEVVAMVDLSEEALKAACEEGGYSSDICFQNIDDALAAVEADAMIVVTPPQYHCDPVIKGLEAGLDVISEKPMADSMENCRKMLQAAKDTGRTYVVSQNYRYTPDTWTIADLVRQGKIGEVGQVNIDFFLGMDFGGGFRHSMEHPLIVDMSIHHCDLIRFITGLNPVSVSGDSWNPPWSNYDGDVSNSLLFEMDNGARISYSGSWASKGIHCSWNGNWMIQGDKGSITYDKDGVITLHEVPGLYSVEKTTVIDKLEVPHGEGQAYVLNRFIHCIENGETPETIVDDNIFSVAMVYASVEAVESGKKVPVLDDAFLALLK